jgi:hypothetical protein
LTFVTWLKVVFVFFHCKVAFLFFPLLSYLKESSYSQSTLRNKGLCSSSFRAEYLHQLVINSSWKFVSSLPFIYSIIYFCQYRLMNIYNMRYNFTLFLKFFHALLLGVFSICYYTITPLLWVFSFFGISIQIYLIYLLP